MNRFEAIAEAKQSILRLHEGWRDNALFSILRYAGRKWVGQGKARYGMCHAGVRDLRPNDGRPDVRYVVSAINRPKPEDGGAYKNSRASDESAKKWLDYIINRSPYGAAFFEKDVEKAWDEKCVVLYVKNIPGNVVQGALIATRMTWEYGRIVEAFVDMVEAGVSEHVAFMTTHVIAKKKDKGLYYLNASGSQHTVLAYGYLSAGWKNYLNSTPKLLKPKYPEGKGTSDSIGVHVLWSGENGRAKMGDVTAAVRKWARELSTTRVDTNPFAKAKPRKSEEEVYFSLEVAVEIAKRLEAAHA